MALLVEGGKCKIQEKKVHCGKSNIFYKHVGHVSHTGANFTTKETPGATCALSQGHLSDWTFDVRDEPELDNLTFPFDFWVLRTGLVKQGTRAGQLIFAEITHPQGSSFFFI